MKLLIALALLLGSSILALGQSTDTKKIASDADVPRITIEDAKKALDDGSAVFVDSRSAEAYKEEHIKGAVIIEGAESNRFSKLPKGKKIIVYCS